jgi:hypothetical protein
MVLVAAMVLWIAPRFQTAPEDPRSVERLRRVAAAINRSLPAMLDRETELFSTEGAPAMLVYHYRLVGFAAADVNPEEFAAAAKQQVVQGACGHPATREDFLTKGVTLRYSYYDKDKHHIATVDVSPNDCGF